MSQNADKIAKLERLLFRIQENATSPRSYPRAADSAPTSTPASAQGPRSSSPTIDNEESANQRATVPSLEVALHQEQEEARKKAEAEARKKAEQEAKAAEAKKAEEEAAAHKAEEARVAAEAKKAAEAQAAAKEAEEASKAAEAKKADDARKAEEARLAAEARQADETRRQAEIDAQQAAIREEEARRAAAARAAGNAPTESQLGGTVDLPEATGAKLELAGESRPPPSLSLDEAEAELPKATAPGQFDAKLLRTPTLEPPPDRPTMRPDGTEIAAARERIPSDVPPAPAVPAAALHIPRPGAIRLDAEAAPPAAPVQPAARDAAPVAVDVVTADAVQRRVTNADVAVFLQAAAAPRPATFGAILDDSLSLGELEKPSGPHPPGPCRYLTPRPLSNRRPRRALVRERVPNALPEQRVGLLTLRRARQQPKRLAAELRLAPPLCPERDRAAGGEGPGGEVGWI